MGHGLRPPSGGRAHGLGRPQNLEAAAALCVEVAGDDLRPVLGEHLAGALARRLAAVAGALALPVVAAGAVEQAGIEVFAAHQGEGLPIAAEVAWALSHLRADVGRKTL